MSDLSQFLQKKININSDLIALKDGNKVLTYNELNFHSSKVAAIILKFKKDSNEIIGVYGQRNFSSYIAILASVYSGCCYTPLNEKQKSNFVKSVLTDTKINLFITDSKNFKTLKKTLLSLDYFKNCKIFFTDKDYYFDLESDKKVLIENNSKSLNHDSKNNDNVYILYTSGSTGTPKGVQISHSNLFSWSKNMCKNFKITPRDNISQNYDLTFDLSVSDMILSWTAGATLCILNSDEQMMPSDYILREKITIWSSTPTIASFLLKMGILKKNIFPEVRMSFFCGEALNQSLANTWLEACPNSKLINFYGPTEATIWISSFDYNRELINSQFTNKIVPIGKPFKNHYFEIIDEKFNLLDKGFKGEIIYSGPQISKGYRNNDIKNTELFRLFSWDKNENIWYLSGDLGIKKKDGTFEFLGRKDNQIKIAGRRVEIEEIEATILKYEGIDSVIVVPIKNTDKTCNRLIAFLSKKIDDKELVTIKLFFSDYMDSIFFPKEFKFLEKFPLNSSGKVNRKLLEDRVNN